MKFHFPLATVLRLREIAEEREERVLGQVLSQLSSLRQSIVEMRERRQSLLQRREGELRDPISAFQLQYSYGQVYMLEGLILEGQQSLVKLEQLRVQQTKIYEAARQAREVLSDLYEKQLALHMQQQTRREQAVMDDNFAARRHLR